MPKYLITLLLLFFHLTFPSPIHASEIATQSGIVTATVPSAPTTDDNLPPTPPILIRPADNSATANPHPELVWDQSTDPDGNTIYYDLYLDGVATYLGISNTGNSAGAGYTTTIVDNEIRLIPTTALPDGEYDWYVRAYDPTSDYNNSTTWQLEIDTTPPEFTITSIDIHHNLTLDSRDPTTIPEGTSFEVSGPKDIYFTIETEPNTTIQLAFYNSDGEFVTQTSYPYIHLEPGIYTVQTVAIDHVLLTSTIPNFLLVVTQPILTLPGTPPTTIPIPPTISDLPSTLTHLPATIARISTRGHIAVAIFAMLALAIYLLLIFLKNRRYNLLLINPQGTPLQHATVYHSKPGHRAPFRYPLTTSDNGKLYIPHLNRYSTLTIRTNPAGPPLPAQAGLVDDSRVTILSVARYHSPITLIV